MKAIIFFGHGARDLRWREPFDRLVTLWCEQYPKTPVELAFLELMQPSLSGAIQKIASRGIKDIVVIPVFFGQGSHLRNVVPPLDGNPVTLAPDGFDIIKVVIRGIKACNS